MSTIYASLGHKFSKTDVEEARRMAENIVSSFEMRYLIICFYKLL